MPRSIIHNVLRGAAPRAQPRILKPRLPIVRGARDRWRARPALVHEMAAGPVVILKVGQPGVTTGPPCEAERMRGRAWRSQLRPSDSPCMMA